MLLSKQSFITQEESILNCTLTLLMGCKTFPQNNVLLGLDVSHVLGGCKTDKVTYKDKFNNRTRLNYFDNRN